MNNLGWPGAYGGTPNYSQILEELQSGEEMRIYTAVMELSQNLQLAQENTMTNFSIDAYVEALNTILNFPSGTDLTPDIEFNCIICLINIMDIFPTSVNTIVNKSNENGSLIGALSAKIENLQYIDVAEKAIKALERISTEASNSVLANSNLDTILNMTDFFELDTQVSVLKMISNITMNLGKEEDLQKLIPLLPILTNLFEVKGPGEKHSTMFSLMCTIFQNI